VVTEAKQAFYIFCRGAHPSCCPWHHSSAQCTGIFQQWIWSNELITTGFSYGSSTLLSGSLSCNEKWCHFLANYWSHSKCRT